MKTQIGDKFYKVIDGKLDIIRLSRIKNSDCFILINSNKEKIKLTNKQLEEYYRLKPDGHVAFSIVQLENGFEDVIVTLYRRADLDTGIELPYCACRQNVFDVFTNQILKRSGIMYVGVSVSVDTCPEDTPYQIMLACNGIVQIDTVSIYLDDSLEDILQFITPFKYDDVLEKMYKGIQNSEVEGYCKSLKHLLTENDFMYDFQKGFNIDRAPFVISIQEDYQLAPEQTTYLEDLFKVEMFRTYVIEFTKEIDLKKVQRSYNLILDANNKLYIVAYDRGQYINRVYEKNIKDKREAVALLKSKKRTQ